MKPYKFIRTGNEWYVDLPEFIEQGGSVADLQMVDGADEMLDMMAGNRNSVTVRISNNPFDGSDVLSLTEMCDPYIGGGYYLMKMYEGQEINRTMWLCRVTEFIFGSVPEHIFVKREST